MAGVATLTEAAAEAMRAQVVDFCFAMAALVGLTQGGTEAEPYRDSDDIVFHAETHSRDRWGVKPGAGLFGGHRQQASMGSGVRGGVQEGVKGGMYLGSIPRLLSVGG